MESFGMTESKLPYWEMGRRIIEARETFTDMNQSAMTEALGLKEPTYGNYERGLRRMPPHVMDKFKDITGCMSDWIYLGKGPKSALTEKELELLNLIRQMEKEDIAETIRFVKYRLSSADLPPPE